MASGQGTENGVREAKVEGRPRTGGKIALGIRDHVAVGRLVRAFMMVVVDAGIEVRQPHHLGPLKLGSGLFDTVLRKGDNQRPGIRQIQGRRQVDRQRTIARRRWGSRNRYGLRVLVEDRAGKVGLWTRLRSEGPRRLHRLLGAMRTAWGGGGR